MKLFDMIFAGKVLKAVTLEETFLGLGHKRKSLLLVERGGEPKLVFKWSGFFLFLGSVQYFDVSWRCAERLRDFLDEADRIVEEQQRSRDLDKTWADEPN